eukprot:scaffold106446_cov16-Prasinocladus_malaysianus.AAC.1
MSSLSSSPELQLMPIMTSFGPPAPSRVASLASTRLYFAANMLLVTDEETGAGMNEPGRDDGTRLNQVHE